ncbi:MAG TPA: chemotaxis protein CheW [Sphingobium sp.]|nr:chemotaxis protein CheW [Sphingobium sp.]
MSAEDRLVFRAGDRRYALPARRVRELARMPRLTSVPLAPPGLLGLGNVRGETLAILSPAALEDGTPSGEARQLLVLAGADRVAIAIDAVERLAQGTDVADLPIDDLVARGFPLRDGARRADRATAAREPRTIPEERVALLRFAIGEQSFALPVEEVAQVLRVPASIARLPGADAAVLGTIDWQDMTIGLLSLAALLGLPSADEEAFRARRRILVVALGHHRLGLLVDRIEAMMQVPASRIDSVPATVLRGEGEARIRAICRPEAGGKLVSILAADQLLNEARTRQLLATGGRDQTVEPAAAPGADRVALLPVRIGGHRLAFPVAAIERVAARPSRLTPLPGAPAWLPGICALAGEPLAIVDQVLRLSGSAATGARQRLLLLRAHGQRIGYLVDEARAIIMAERSALLPAPLPEGLAGGIFGEALQHQGEEGDAPLLVVDPGALVSSTEQALIADMAASAATAAP